MYKCETCRTEFKYNSLYMKHINKKRKCDSISYYDNKCTELNEQIDEINKNILPNENKIVLLDKKLSAIENKIKTKINKSIQNGKKCVFCDSIFLNKWNLSRHLDSSCLTKKNLVLNKDNLLEEKTQFENKIKEHNDKINELRDKIKEFTDHKNQTIEDKREKEKYDEIKKNKEKDKEIKQLRKDIAKLLKKQAPIINQTINNTQNNLVVINPFGKEDLSHITIKDYKNYLNGFFPGFIKYVEKVHFDENAPQNHNIHVSNLKSKYLSVHNGDRWETKVKNDIIDKLIMKKHNQLADKCEELEEDEEIDKKIVDNFEEFCGSFKDKDAQKTVKTDIMTMLYDNNNKISFSNKKSLKNESDSELESESEIEEEIKPKKKVKSITN